MKVLVSLLLAAVCLLAVPGAAMATTYTVNNTGDQEDETPGAEGCKTSGSTCTLRAAIEEANFDSGADTIKFSPIFNGQVADSIALGSSLPAIEFPLTIDGDAEGAGGQCTTEAGVKGPCAEVTGPVGGAALIVENADKVAIEGLALTGQTGGGSAIIDVIDSSEEFKAADNWLGVRLDGTSSSNTKGIYLDPGSDKAVIGGISAVERNVIVNTEFEALDIEGANEATIQGNYFGVKPDGTTAATNSKNIEITGRTGLTPAEDIEAEDNEIGATIEGPALTSAACDGGCNVISAATGSGIDLNGFAPSGEKPASGPTTIHGNFIGLNAAGTGTIANAGIGIWAGGAEHVTVGGFEVGDANYVAGGSEGIVSESGGEDFNALGNQIGFGSDGSEQTAPAEKGILALALNVAEDPEIEGNTVRMAGGVGIESRFLTGRIIDNEIEGGGIGIKTVVGSGAGLISSNTVTAPTEVGILVESPDNDVRGNSVFSSGGAGIKVRNPPGVAMTGNTIGSSDGDENVLESNAGPAIEILEEALEPGSTTEITRNRGSLNGGPFITLLNGANGGIAPPTAATATSTSASGTAKPNATVRVFSKAESAAGELKGFLAETEADGSGNWNVTFPAVAGGTLVTATQTVSKATSQLAAPVAVPNEPSGGGGSGGKDDKAKDDKGNGKAKGKDDSGAGAPQTTIRKVKVSGAKATFKFTSSTKGAKFECKLDKQKFKSCKSPKTYKKLKPGKHVFKVRAVKGKKVDPTPAKRKFKIVA